MPRVLIGVTPVLFSPRPWWVRGEGGACRGGGWGCPRTDAAWLRRTCESHSIPALAHPWCLTPALAHTASCRPPAYRRRHRSRRFAACQGPHHGPPAAGRWSSVPGAATGQRRSRAGRRAAAAALLTSPEPRRGGWPRHGTNPPKVYDRALQGRLNEQLAASRPSPFPPPAPPPCPPRSARGGGARYTAARRGAAPRLLGLPGGAPSPPSAQPAGQPDGRRVIRATRWSQSSRAPRRPAPPGPAAAPSPAAGAPARGRGRGRPARAPGRGGAAPGTCRPRPRSPPVCVCVGGGREVRGWGGGCQGLGWGGGLGWGQGFVFSRSAPEIPTTPTTTHTSTSTDPHAHI